MSEDGASRDADTSQSGLQGGDGKSLDALSSGDEFLFNFVYPLAVDVFFFPFLIIIINLIFCFSKTPPNTCRQHFSWCL